MAQLKSLFALLISVLALNTCLAQTPQASSNPNAESIGSSSCILCHSNPNPLASQNSIGMQQARLFLGRDEKGNPIGDNTDPHATAIAKILNSDGSPTPRTKIILDNLNLSIQDPKFINQCLTCHAGQLPIPQDNPTPSTPHLGRSQQAFNLDRSSFANQSIGCEACHGASSLYFLPHQSQDWLPLSATAKSQKGFYDLANASVAAQVCLSCHLGSAKESKSIPHTTYAAGHPPLPPVDLAKFLDSTCEKHWISIQEKSNRWTPSLTQPDPRKEYLLAHFTPSNPSAETIKSEIANHFPKSQKSFISLETSFVLNAREILYQANSGTWGDFATFDCIGCHQTLYKQIRPSTEITNRTPGRPLWPFWTRLPSASHIASKLDQAFLEQPFGNPHSLTESPEQLEQAIAEKLSSLEQLAKQPFTQPQAEAWLRSLLAHRKNFIGNEWVAKQTYWAIEMYFDDLANFQRLNPNNPKLPPHIVDAFLELQKKSPPITQLTSCMSTQTSQSPRIPTETQQETVEFIQSLQRFIEDFTQL